MSNYPSYLKMINDTINECIRVATHYRDLPHLVPDIQMPTNNDANYCWNDRKTIWLMMETIIHVIDFKVTNQQSYKHKFYKRWLIEMVINCPIISMEQFVEKIYAGERPTYDDIVGLYKTQLNLNDLEKMQMLKNCNYVNKCSPSATVVSIEELNADICEFISVK